VKQAVKAFLAAMVIFVAACDPGMTIHQVKSLREVPSGGGAPSPQVAINIETSHPFIGETWYTSRVGITNWFDLPITVTSIDLTAQGSTLTAKPPQPGSYPFVVLPRETKTLFVLIDLHDDVKKTFRKPAELHVHYRNGDKEEIASTAIVGGPLNYRPP
jgi:hypothetical protein